MINNGTFFLPIAKHGNIDFVISTINEAITWFYSNDNVGNLSDEERDELPCLNDMQPIGYINIKSSNDIYPYYYEYMDYYIYKYHTDEYYVIKGTYCSKCYINENIKLLNKLCI